MSNNNKEYNKTIKIIIHTLILKVFVETILTFDLRYIIIFYYIILVF